MFDLATIEDWDGAAPAMRPAHRPRQSHCKRGHAYDAENTRMVGGKRHCRACLRLHARLYRVRAKARPLAPQPLEDARPACPGCRQTARQIKRGRNPSGSQRYRCLWCGRTYTPWRAASGSIGEDKGEASHE